MVLNQSDFDVNNDEDDVLNTLETMSIECTVKTADGLNWKTGTNCIHKRKINQIHLWTFKTRETATTKYIINEAVKMQQ